VPLLFHVSQDFLKTSCWVFFGRLPNKFFCVDEVFYYVSYQLRKSKYKRGYKVSKSRVAYL
jgi:hypothetical protein